MTARPTPGLPSLQLCPAVSTRSVPHSRRHAETTQLSRLGFGRIDPRNHWRSRSRKLLQRPAPRVLTGRSLNLTALAPSNGNRPRKQLAAHVAVRPSRRVVPSRNWDRSWASRWVLAWSRIVRSRTACCPGAVSDTFSACWKVGRTSNGRLGLRPSSREDSRIVRICTRG